MSKKTYKKNNKKYKKTYKKYKKNNKKSSQKGGQNIKAFVINLDKRADRWKTIQKNFKDITLERVSAIDDTIGWKGCGLSHVKVVKEAKEKGLPFVLIMEDDCVPTEFFKDNIGILQRWLEQNMDKWDIATTGTTYYGFHANDEDTISPICALSTLKLYTVKMTSTQCFFINSNAYDSFISWEKNLETSDTWNPIDFWPNKQNMKTISCTPFLTRQLNDFSNIENTVRNYDTEYNTSEKLIATIPNLTPC